VKNILLSVFGTFGEYRNNTTELVARRLLGSFLAGYKVHVIKFPATIPATSEINRGIRLFREALRIEASAILSLGMASAKTGLCVEQQARNLNTNAKYCGEALHQPVDQNQKLGELLELNLDQWNIGKFIRECRKERVRVMRPSSDAGGFCCNHLAYQARLAQLSRSEWDEIPYIFIHTPCSPEAIAEKDKPAFIAAKKTMMSMDEIVYGLEILVGRARLGRQSNRKKKTAPASV